MYLDRDDVKGLWRNTRNSMYHAFEHFSELAANQGDKEHHPKWIVLSVHLAAECFLKILLKELDPTDSYFKDSKGRVRFPNLSDILLALRKLEHAGRLSRAEEKLLDLLDELSASGLLFSFDEYSVGPYATGRQEIWVPFSELSDLVLPEELKAKT